MTRVQSSMSSGTEMQAEVSVRAQRRSLQACIVLQIIEVIRTLTRLHT
jgi:hypothetical protein